jgi:hypothetical protein
MSGTEEGCSAEGKSYFMEALSGVAGNRRVKVRFPLRLKVRYRPFGRTPGLLGNGWLVDVSSGGALVISENETLVGAKVELAMEWPSLLDGNIPLQLVARGCVVRCSAESFAVKFQRYQFRTMKRGVQLIEDPFAPPVRSLRPPLLPVSMASSRPGNRLTANGNNFGLSPPVSSA